jgi:hypothetical protein
MKNRSSQDRGDLSTVVKQDEVEAVPRWDRCRVRVGGSLGFTKRARASTRVVSPLSGHGKM